MKSLVISVDYPLPEDRGNRMRTMHFVRCLQQYGEVDLMCYKSHVPQRHVPNPFAREYHIDMSRGEDAAATNPLQTMLDRLIQAKPWIVDNYSRSSIRYVHDTIMEGNYDAILCRYAVSAYPLLTLPLKYRQKVILDIDDLMSNDLYDAINGHKKGLAKIKTMVDKKILERYQVRCLELGNIVFCSEADRLKMVRHNNPEKMHVVPNIIPHQHIPESYQVDGHRNRYLLFVGNLSYKPNEMGIMWFIKEIFDRLPEEFSTLRLLVVGKNPQDALKKLCSQNKRIELVENPPDVMPYFERSLAIVVPVLVGGGTRIKILEAGNCHRPVISTRLGAYGLELEEFRHLLYFSDSDSFQQRLLWLSNRDNYLKLVKNLRIKIETDYSRETFHQGFCKILHGS